MLIIKPSDSPPTTLTTLTTPTPPQMTTLLWKRSRYHYLANKHGAQYRTAIRTDRHERKELWEECTGHTARIRVLAVGFPFSTRFGFHELILGIFYIVKTLI